MGRGEEEKEEEKEEEEEEEKEEEEKEKEEKEKKKEKKKRKGKEIPQFYIYKLPIDRPAAVTGTNILHSSFTLPLPPVHAASKNNNN